MELGFATRDAQTPASKLFFILVYSAVDWKEARLARVLSSCSGYLENTINFLFHIYHADLILNAIELTRKLIRR
jgi:hypothetical protein